MIAEYVSVLKNLKIEGGKTLVVVPQKDENALSQSRNLQGHNIQIADNLNTYEILDCDKIVLVGNSHEIIQDILKK
jgi:large subunit ribosomal protein L4